MSESQLYALQCELIALLAAGLFLVFVMRRLLRRQPELAIWKPVMIAFGVRLAVAFGLGQTTMASQLRGGDAEPFRRRARCLRPAGPPRGRRRSIRRSAHRVGRFLSDPALPLRL